MSLLRLFQAWRGPQRRVGNETPNDTGQSEAVEQLLAVGRQQRLNGCYTNARDSLNRAIDLKHDCGEAYHELGSVQLLLGEFENAADSLEMAVHFLPQSGAAHLELAAAHFKLGRLDAAATSCRRAVELDAAQAAAWFRLGNIEKQRGDHAAAMRCFERAIELDAACVDACCQLAYLLYKAGRYAESRAVAAGALAVDPGFSEIHHNLGLALLEEGYPEEALASFSAARDLRPHRAETATCIAHALRDLGRLQEARAAYEVVLKDQPEFGDAVINRAYAMLMDGDYRNGWREYERRNAATGTPQRDFGFPEWKGQSLKGRRILIYAEQGMGDEIMFASCMPDLLAGCDQVVLECNTQLAPLFARSFERTRVHGGSKMDDKTWLSATPPCHYQVAIGSLPLHFRIAADQFPQHKGYLRADAASVERWKQRLSASVHLRVGIAWRGGSLRTRQATRSIPLAQWQEILQTPDTEFVSLQYGDVGEELAQMQSASGAQIRSFGADLHAAEDVAALICALDLVISVDNTVLHFAGALGRQAWGLLNTSPEWRYPRAGAVMPWYPSVRLFRQSRPRDWTSVLDEVGHELRSGSGAFHV